MTPTASTSTGESLIKAAGQLLDLRGDVGIRPVLLAHHPLTRPVAVTTAEL